MMKKLLSLLMILALLGSAVALAEGFSTAPPSPSPSIDESITNWLSNAASSVEEWAQTTGELEVRGQAVRTVAPDTVSMRVGASVDHEREKAAQEKANAIINDVIEKLRALGVEDSQIATSGYNVTRKHKYVGRTYKPDGYTARVTLTIKVQDFDLINQILDAAVACGANDVGSIAFSYSDEGAVYRQALADAIAAARAKAEIMAEASGVQLRALLAVREGSYGGAYTNSYERAALDESEGAGSSTQIMSGEIEISASVTLLYQTK